MNRPLFETLNRSAVADNVKSGECIDHIWAINPSANVRQEKRNKPKSYKNTKKWHTNLRMSFFLCNFAAQNVKT